MTNQSEPDWDEIRATKSCSDEEWEEWLKEVLASTPADWGTNKMYLLEELL